MTSQLDRLFEQAKDLPRISKSATQSYIKSRQLMVDHVNRALVEEKNYDETIATSDEMLLYNNHEHHSLLMSTVMQLGNYDIMINAFVWAYRSYHARGLPFDYFLDELKSWQSAAAKILPVNDAREIIDLYEWIINRHTDFIEAAENNPEPKIFVPEEYLQTKTRFLENLLRGDSRSCIRIANETVNSQDDTKNFYLYVIQPSMYEIGISWETGKVSVAQEHLASAIIARIMANLYQSYVLCVEPTDKNAVVATAPHESHETGARMAADFLEMNGWDVSYLGADLPPEEIHNRLAEQKPFLFMISVTMPYNLYSAQKAISFIKNDPCTKNTMVMCGGLAFKESPQIWKQMGADGIAFDAEEGIKLAEQWYREAFQDEVG